MSVEGVAGRLRGLRQKAGVALPLPSSAFLSRAVSSPVLLDVAAVTSIVWLAIYARLWYVAGTYTYTFGSGDAYGYLLKSLYFSNLTFETPEHDTVITSVFDTPFLVPMSLAAISQAFRIPLGITPFVLTPIVTILAIVALYFLLRDTLGRLTAFIGTLLLATHHWFAFMSTEPLKAPYVVSFFIFSLYFLSRARSQPRWLLASGFFLALANLTHWTGLFFVPVYVLTYFILFGFTRKSLLNRYFLAGLAAVASVVLICVALARAFEPASLNIDSQSENATWLPRVIQVYVDAATFHIRNGFSDVAGQLYYDAVRTQLTTPVFVMGIVGFLAGLWSFAVSRNRQVGFFLLWMAIIFGAFALQFRAASHGSRYPSYVNPAFFVAAGFAVSQGLSRLPELPRLRVVRVGLGALIIALVLAFPVRDYLSTSLDGYRHIYNPHRDLAAYVVDQGLLEDGSGILYLGWPSITYYLLEGNDLPPDSLHTYGWNSIPLETFSRQYIQDHNIGYFAYDATGTDYYNSANKLRHRLAQDFTLRELASFRPGRSSAALYELAPK